MAGRLDEDLQGRGEGECLEERGESDDRGHDDDDDDNDDRCLGFGVQEDYLRLYMARSRVQEKWQKHRREGRWPICHRSQ